MHEPQIQVLLLLALEESGRIQVVQYFLEHS